MKIATVLEPGPRSLPAPRLYVQYQVATTSAITKASAC